jgi:hypothetical protein
MLGTTCGRHAVAAEDLLRKPEGTISARRAASTRPHHSLRALQETRRASPPR